MPSSGPFSPFRICTVHSYWIMQGSELSKRARHPRESQPRASGTSKQGSESWILGTALIKLLSTTESKTTWAISDERDEPEALALDGSRPLNVQRRPSPAAFSPSLRLSSESPGKLSSSPCRRSGASSSRSLASCSSPAPWTSLSRATTPGQQTWPLSLSKKPSSLT